MAEPVRALTARHLRHCQNCDGSITTASPARAEDPEGGMGRREIGEERTCKCLAADRRRLIVPTQRQGKRGKQHRQQKSIAGNKTPTKT